MLIDKLFCFYFLDIFKEFLLVLSNLILVCHKMIGVISQIDIFATPLPLGIYVFEAEVDNFFYERAVPIIILHPFRPIRVDSFVKFCILSIGNLCVQLG